jgi:hypothetical protein
MAMNQLQLKIFSIGEHTGQEMARNLRQRETHKPIKERSRKEKCGSMLLEEICISCLTSQDMTVIMQASFMVAELSYCKGE